MSQFLRFFLFSFLVSSVLHAQVLANPKEIMQSYYPDTKVEKKNLILSESQVQQIQQEAKAQLDNKVMRIYRAYKGEEVIAFGVLLSKNIRSKNGVFLYLIDKETNKLRTVEMIAFNEPLEYLPSGEWKKQFQEVETSKELRVGENIHTITGATLSARSITQGSRIAFALYKTLLTK